jgi:hypothetical protein
MSGPINDINTLAELPNNEWTQMIEAVRSRNQRGTSLSPDELAAGVPVVGTPMPSVRSADLGKRVRQPVDDPNRPLSAAEIEELNKAAIASGLVRGPVNPSIARTLGGEVEDSPYASLEEAIAAGAPVGADAEAIAEGAAAFREPTLVAPVIQVRTPVGMRRMTASESPVGSAAALPRLPDFKKVQMIDMVNGKVYVDGLEFAIEPGELKMLRKFCVTKAKDQVQKALDAALKELAEDTDGGDAEAM